MNQTLESIKMFFDYNKKPLWKIINADTNSHVTDNYIVDDMALSWERFVIAYNNYLFSGSYKLYVKSNKDTADNKSPMLPITKTVGMAGISGISGMGDMSMMQQFMLMQQMQMQNPHLAGVNAKNEDKLERLQEDNTRLKEELLAAKFTAQINELKRDNKESTRKRGIGEIAAPLLQQHLPTIINAISGNNIPRAAVGIADTNEQIPVPVPIVKNTETVTGSDSLQKTDILIEPGFHSIDHAVMMLEELETLLPDFNINHVLQNLVVSTQTNPDNMKMMIQNYL